MRVDCCRPAETDRTEGSWVPWSRLSRSAIEVDHPSLLARLPHRACWLRVLAPEQRSVGFALRVRRVFGVVVVGPYGLEEVSAVEPHHGPDSRRTHFEYWLDQVHRPARALIDALRLIVVLCHAVPRFASFWFI